MYKELLTYSKQYGIKSMLRITTLTIIVLQWRLCTSNCASLGYRSSSISQGIGHRQTYDSTCKSIETSKHSSSIHCLNYTSTIKLLAQPNEDVQRSLWIILPWNQLNFHRGWFIFLQVNCTTINQLDSNGWTWTSNGFSNEFKWLQLDVKCIRTYHS